MVSSWLGLCIHFLVWFLTAMLLPPNGCVQGKKHLYTKWEPEDERGWDQLNRPQDVIANAQSHISTGLS